ncbi:MAG: S-methyl-5-thioribose-1-phosphate isomerase [Oceanococcus sp.]
MTTYDRASTSLKFCNGRLSILDQRLLPHQEQWHDCADSKALILHIHSLAVRGAPLIGIAAALMLAQRALQGASTAQLQTEWKALRASRPTAVNLMNYLDQLQPLLNSGNPDMLRDAALNIFDNDRALCLGIAEAGCALIQTGSRVLTHCNTGSLATAGVGTALGIITHAHSLGLAPKVWVDETRPLLQGSRLTTWELARAGVEQQLICDNMSASLMAAGEVDLVLVGADRIAANGDTANKIGTYALAVLARHHNIPFYIAAPSTTIDPNCPNGAAIPVEQRAADEVRGVSTAQGSLRFSPEGCSAYNPAFDVTPAKLISAWVTEHGVHTAPEQLPLRT